MDSKVIEQYEALREHAAFTSFGERTLIELQGADRASFLHNLCTNDVCRLSPGQGCEAFFTTVQGKVLCHGLLFDESDSIVFESSPGHAATLLPHLDKYLIREDVTLVDRSRQWQEFWLGGPRSGEVLETLGIDAPANMLDHTVWSQDGFAAHVRKVPFANVDCFVLQCELADVSRLEHSLAATHATEVDASVAEIARIEAGFPSYGRDITLENLPQEVARDKQAISFTKGCYLGQETVARIDALGRVNRHLVGLKFAGSDVPPDGSLLRCNEKNVGRVTSACLSPPLRTALALGYVRREVMDAGGIIGSDVGEAEIIGLTALKTLNDRERRRKS